jgi:hypothetical protein
MKALLRWPVKFLWNRTRFLRRPLIERYATFLRRVQGTSMDSSSMEVQWECVILELMRLQDQVERLQASIDEMSHARSSLTVVNEDTESGEARLRVG